MHNINRTLLSINAGGSLVGIILVNPMGFLSGLVGLLGGIMIIVINWDEFMAKPITQRVLAWIHRKSSK